MSKKILSVLFLVSATLLFSGCSLSPTAVKTAPNPMANATVLKTLDGGATWQAKIKVDDKKTIANVDVLSMAIDPIDAKIVYLGTQVSGLFVSKDGAETWAPVAFPDKAYNIVFDPSSHDTMYASGVLKGRAKIFKRLKEEQQWKEIYTEPADGTVISALAINKVNSQVLFAGTSEGVIIKTTDGGVTWTNIKKADGPVISIIFDSSDERHVFFAIFEVGVLETKDGGKMIEDISRKIDTKSNTTSVYSLAGDPSSAGVVYVGTGSGIFKKTGAGDLWEAVNIIESSKAFPIRAIAINPTNSKEIMYASAKALYKSTDGGTQWATFQLDTTKEIGVLKYDQTDPTKLYGGLRKY
jgi:photosystem II stability/assembly factor-like uncharacterized protein